MSSAVDGPISRVEALSRCQFWVDRGITYTQTGPWAADPQGKTYRRDCSGLVSMAWHLSTSRTTYTFDGWSGLFVLPSLHDLKAGDALLATEHVELFVRWVNPANHGDGAYVYSFNSDGETVENPAVVSNYGNLGRDSWSELLTYRPVRYRQIVDASPTGGSDGAILREPDGSISIVVGGAPFHLTPDEYAALGSPAYSDVAAGTFDKMPSLIANGTLVRTTDGSVYIVAGSAKWHLTAADYSALGSPPFINVPDRLIATLDATPHDGTYLRDLTDHAVYEIVCGTSYHLSPAEYSALGSPQWTNVPPEFIKSLSAPVPADGRYLRDPADGAVYEVAGGAKYHLSSAEFAALGSPQPVNVPTGLLNQIGTTPVDGAFLRDITDGAIYQIVGGAKYHLSPAEYAELNSAPAVDVPAGFIATITRSVPAAGFMRKADTGAIYQVVNGAGYHLSADEYTALGNPAYVNVPPGFIDRLTAVPANGTLIRDVASGAVYEIIGGARYHLNPDEYTALGSPAYVNVPAGFAAAATGTVPAGELYLREAGSGAIYQVVGGAKYHLGPDEYAALGNPGFSVVPTGLLATLGNVPADGTHLRRITDGAIYTMTAGAAHYLTPDAWYALTDHSYTNVTPAFLNQLPAG